MLNISDEEQSCFKWYRWMKPREIRGNVKQYFEQKQKCAMVEPSSHCKTRQRSDEGRLNCAEKMPISRRKAFVLETNKENNVPKDSESSGDMVKRLKMRYEEILNSRKNVTSTNVDNGRASGAIKKSVGEEKNFGGTKKRVEFGEENSGASKKRVDFSENNNSGAIKRVDFSEDNNGGAKKRVKVDEGFAKSRFKIYVDKPLRVSSDERATKTVKATSDGNVAADQQSIQNRRLGMLITESSISVQQRCTPIEGTNEPLVPKKVKIQHRKNLMIGDEQPKNRGTAILQGPVLHQLLYEDNFIKVELEKETSLCRMLTGYRRKNITVEQRKIILKFLIRLNVHAFYPSFVLHQTVRIFDAALDAKMIEVKNLQLVALASMWIALKREEIAYRVPSASTMISYSKDLYDGRVDLLVKCEMEILKLLNFQIVFPDPFSVLYYYITTCNWSQFLEDKQINLAYYCGGYMIDLSLFNDELMQKSALLVAAAAAETALFFAAGEDVLESPPSWRKWRAPDAASRYSTEEIGHVRSILIQLIENSHHRHTDGEIIFKKYSRSRYGKISHFLCNKVEQILNVDVSVD